MTDESAFDYRALDDVIHSRIRLAVMAILASVEDVEFTYLREKVGATDGNLSTHLARLTDAGYVAVEKSVVAGRAVSRYRLSTEGRAAFARYLARMEQLLGGVER
jgi:DNA-binding MarR family transcriptional regulator